MERSTLLALCRDVVAVSRERGISVASAGLAYHAFNTLVPLVVLLLVGVTVVDALEIVIETVERAAGLEGGRTLETLDRVTGDGGADRVRATLLALVVFLWSAVRMFQAINSAFSGVYGSRKETSYRRAALDVSLTTLTTVLGVALVAVVGVTLSAVVREVWWAVVSPLLLLALLAISFLPMYYRFPQPAVSVREVLPGTVFAAVTWTVLAIGFRVYVVTADSVALFGIAGGVLLLLTWVYLGGFCLLLGAVFNAVLADRVEGDDGWVPAEDTLSEYA